MRAAPECQSQEQSRRYERRTRPLRTTRPSCGTRPRRREDVANAFEAKVMSEREHLCADGLLTVAEATQFIGLGKSMLYQLMERGRLPYVRIGRARRIPKRALVQLAAGNLVGYTEGQPGGETA